jgi:hypothetical protein
MPQSASVWGGLRPSIDAKLSRAEHHLGKLSEAIEGAAESDLLKTWTDRDRQGRVRVRVKEVGEIPMEWHVRIGECVYNMPSRLWLEHHRLGTRPAAQSPGLGIPDLR